MGLFIRSECIHHTKNFIGKLSEHMSGTTNKRTKKTIKLIEFERTSPREMQCIRKGQATI